MAGKTGGGGRLIGVPFLLVASTAAIVLLAAAAPGASADYSQDEFMQWLESLGEQGVAVNAPRQASNFDPQSLSRLLRRSDPSIRLLKRAGDDEEFQPTHINGKRASMVRLMRSSPSEDAEDDDHEQRQRRAGQMVRLLRSGMVRLLKKRGAGMVRLM